MEIEDVSKYIDSLKSSILGQIKEFETNTGVRVETITLSRASVMGKRHPVLIRVDLDVHI